MKIISLNVNNFGGYKTKPQKDKYSVRSEYLTELRKFQNDPKRIETVEKITDMVEMEMPDVIIFQEFDINAPAGRLAIKNFYEYGYLPIYPDKEDAEGICGNSSITMIFTKSEVERYRSPKFKAWKWCGIRTDDLIIIGIHAPDGMRFLKNVQEWAEKYVDEKLIILGDFNIATNKWRIEEKKGDKAFLERVQWLLNTIPSIRYSDSIEGEPVTYFPQKTTIDHVLIAPILQGKVISCVYDKEKYELSDHAVIIVEIKGAS